MKLFTATDIASKREVQTNAELRKLDNVDKKLVSRIQELNRVEKDFEDTLARQKADWERETTEQALKINLLNTEVISLEERKKQSLIPLEDEYRKLDNMKEKIALKEAKLNEKLEDFDDKLELLQEKLTEVSDREVQADKMAKTQAVAQQGIDSQRDTVSHQAKELARVMEETTQHFNLRDITLAERESTISLKEAELISKQERLTEIEKSFDGRELRLKDRYEMLERTKQEINGKRSNR